jgi:hypothetical protein
MLIIKGMAQVGGARGKCTLRPCRACANLHQRRHPLHPLALRSYCSPTCIVMTAAAALCCANFILLIQVADGIQEEKPTCKGPERWHRRSSKLPCELLHNVCGTWAFAWCSTLHHSTAVHANPLQSTEHAAASLTCHDEPVEDAPSNPPSYSVQITSRFDSWMEYMMDRHSKMQYKV